MKTFQQGFTLIELMITVSIIGILAAIAGPAYVDYTIRTQVTEGFSLSGDVQSAISEFYVNYGAFPDNNADAGVADPKAIRGRYVSSVTVHANTVLVQFGNKAHGQIHGAAIALTAEATPSGIIIWACASAGTIKDKHLPVVCNSGSSGAIGGDITALEAS